MTTPHKATPEQWAQLQACAAIYPGAWGDCILELRDRIAALEAGATCPHIVTSDEGTSYCGLAEQGNRQGILDGSPAPSGGLVERVRDIIGLHPVADGKARAAILAVAEWLVEQSPEPGPVGKLLGQISTPFAVMADMLREEVQRNA